MYSNYNSFYDPRSKITHQASLRCIETGW